jgi:hypothetical protein
MREKHVPDVDSLIRATFALGYDTLLVEHFYAKSVCAARKITPKLPNSVAR